MSWAEIKKAVNSDLSTPLNSKIDSQTTSLNSKIDTQTTTLANKFGLTLVEIGSGRNSTKQYSYDVLFFVSAYNSSDLMIEIGTKKFSISRNQTSMLFIPRNTSFKLTCSYDESYIIYKLGGVFNRLLSLITSTNLKKGGVLV